MIKKQIVIFPGYYPPHLGGMETVAAEQAKYLSLKHEVTVFAPRLPKSAPKYEKNGSVTIYRYPAFEIIKNFPCPKLWSLEYWEARKQINRISFDVAVTHTRFFTNALLGLFSAKKKKAKLIHFEHGSAFVKVRSKAVSFISKCYDLTIGKYILNSADQVIAISKQVKHFLQNDLGVKNKVKVIYRGLEFDEIDRIPKLQFANKKINIVTVGRLAKCKGVDNAIEAITSLPDNVKKAIHYHVIGSGIEEDILIRLAGNDKSITFHGELNHSSVISMLKASDIYIHPSNPGGGLATTLLEAMYCRNFIIASPHEGAAEVIDSKVGFLLSGNSPLEIAKIIEQSLQLKTLDWAKENGRKKIRNSFGWSEKVNSYEELFKD